MSIDITFLGASGCVTGSKYLVEYKNYKVLIDCGMFQGPRKWREKNWDTPPIDLKKINAVLLTHAHIDHSGLLPRYFNLGLRCPIYTTSASRALADILLPDVGGIQEQDASYHDRKKTSKHKKPKALYTEKDALDTLSLFKTVKFNKVITLQNDITATYSPMGHILGAASISLTLGDKTLLFSGDIGRYNVPILKDPKAVGTGDYVFMESTYGNRLHPESSTKEDLGRIINATTKRGGVVMIPSFAVGRSQLLLYYIRELKEEGIIDDIPVILDSPLASDATDIYFEHPDNYDKEANKILEKGQHPFEPSKLIFTRAQKSSKKINDIDDPMIIIAGSGMLSGGRIMHHIFRRITSEKNTLLFVGYQPPGGKGDYLQKQPNDVRIFNTEIPVRAKIETLSGLSAHGDKDEMLKWLKDSISINNTKPKKIFLIHGEDDAREDFSKTIKNEFGINCYLPNYEEKITLE